MKISIYITIIAWCFTINSASQEKYYKVENNKIVSIGKKLSKNQITFSKKRIQIESALTTFLATNFVIPILFDKIPTLLYNPKKYIKENNAAYSFIDFENYNYKIPFASQEIMYYKKIIFDTINTDEFKGEKTAIEANFNIHHLDKDNKKISLLELDTFDYYYTSVKLKSNGKKVNLIIEISVNYINTFNEAKTLKLQPLSIEKVVPDGKKNLVNPKKQLF